MVFMVVVSVGRKRNWFRRGSLYSIGWAGRRILCWRNENCKRSRFHMHKCRIYANGSHNGAIIYSKSQGNEQEILAATCARRKMIQHTPQQVRAPRKGLVSQHRTIGISLGLDPCLAADSDQKFGVQVAVPIKTTKASFFARSNGIRCLPFLRALYICLWPGTASTGPIPLFATLCNPNPGTKWPETPRASAAAQTARTTLARCNARTARS